MVQTPDPLLGVQEHGHNVLSAVLRRDTGPPLVKEGCQISNSPDARPLSTHLKAATPEHSRGNRGAILFRPITANQRPITTNHDQLDQGGSMPDQCLITAKSRPDPMAASARIGPPSRACQSSRRFSLKTRYPTDPKVLIQQECALSTRYGEGCSGTLDQSKYTAGRHSGAPTLRYRGKHYQDQAAYRSSTHSKPFSWRNSMP